MIPKRIEQKSKLERSLVSESICNLGENLNSIYSYGSSNMGDSDFNDIDIMIILRQFPSNLEYIRNVQTLANSLKENFNKCDIPLDIHIYGKDEIPTNKSGGYSLFKGFFQLDYLTHRILLFGEDCLSKLPKIDIVKESLDYLSRLRRVIRQYVIDPKMNNTMARALFGLGTLDSHREICVEDNRNLCGFFRYACSIASKAYLECNGEHYISKRKNIERIKDHLKSISPDINFVRNSKKITS